MVHYLMIFHGVISVLLIITVLLQFGRGAEAGFLTGGSSEAVMSGAQRGNVLSKLTTVLAILFLGNSVVLGKLQSKANSSSILDSAPIETAIPAIPVPAKVPTTKPVEKAEPKK